MIASVLKDMALKFYLCSFHAIVSTTPLYKSKKKLEPLFIRHILYN